MFSAQATVVCVVSVCVCVYLATRSCDTLELAGKQIEKQKPHPHDASTRVFCGTAVLLQKLLRLPSLL